MAPPHRSLNDLQEFARSRGGECLTSTPVSDASRYRWRCARDHEFEASPRLLIDAGYWCRECAPNIDDTSGWNYDQAVEHDPFLEKFHTRLRY